MYPSVLLKLMEQLRLVLRKRLNSVINQQFTSSVFTHKNTSTLPDLGASPFSTIVADNINVDGVERLLAGLQGHKAHDPDDGVPARLLTESAHNTYGTIT